MGFRSSKWPSAALGLVLAVGVLPGLAAGEGKLSSGTATQVGFPGCPGPPPEFIVANGGQVRISGTTPLLFPDVDLRTCVLTVKKILFRDVGAVELVKEAGCGGPPSFLGVPLPPKRGGKPNEVIFESDQRHRPTLRLQVKNRGRGELEFASGLKIDRACIFPDGGDELLRTEFSLVCPEVITFNPEPPAFWRRPEHSLHVIGHCLNPADGEYHNLRTP